MPRGRKPLVTQKGNLTVIQQNNRKTEEDATKTGSNQLSRPPEWLINDIAIKEYKRVVKELKKIEIVGNLDKNNIGAYCNAFANYIKVTETLAQQSFYIDRETRTGIIVVKNPLVDIQTNYANEMRRFGSQCGLNIDSRLKAAAVHTTKTEKELERKFGGI